MLVNAAPDVQRSAEPSIGRVRSIWHTHIDVPTRHRVVHRSTTFCAVPHDTA